MNHKDCIVKSLLFTTWKLIIDLVVLVADSKCVLWAIVCPDEADDKTNKGLPRNFQQASVPLLPLIVPSLSRHCFFTTKSCDELRDWNCLLSISQSQLVNEERPIVRCFIRLASDVFSWLCPTTTQLPPNVASDSKLDWRAAHCVIWVELIFSCCATWAQVAGSEE